MHQSPTPGPAEQKEQLDKIAIGLAQALPPGWQELILLFDRLGHAAGIGARLTMSDGRQESWRPPNDALSALEQLRADMYVPERGTWFSCRLSLQLPAQWHIEYYWSEEPPLTDRATPEDYAAEQANFPRSPENMPTWYRTGLPHPAP